MQFTTRTLLYVMAFVGIVCASWMIFPRALALLQLQYEDPLESFTYYTLECSPFWIPVAVACYAIGRRSFGWKTLATLLFAEAAAIAASLIAFHHAMSA